MIRPIVWPLVAVLAVATPALAQQPETRAEALRREREAKSTNLTPPEPTGLKRALVWLENDRLLERLLNPAEGIYPKLGTITPGSGFSMGPAYRRPGLFGGHADLTASALGSFRKYWMLDAKLTLPRLANGAMFAEMGVQRYDFPSEDFFGLGSQSRRGDHVTYGLQNFIVGAGAGVKPAPWLSLGGRVDRLMPRVHRGDPERSIGVLFDTTAAPGLDRQPDFLRYGLYADFNYREPRGNPRRGGRYFVGYEHFDDRDFDRYTFSRIETDLQQYISLLRDRRVLALHVFASLSDAKGVNEVPFYLQRTLGGPDDLRGFRRWRFRDTNVLLLQAEYRWEIFTAVDGAIFYDAGKVTSRREELDLRDLESDYGIGFRFGTLNGVFLRIEGAFGSSAGTQFVFRFNHVF